MSEALDRVRAKYASNGSAPPDDDDRLPPALVFRTLRDWLADYQQPSWLIRDFLIAGAFDVFGGAEKSLKSWLMHHVAIALAAKLPLFNDPSFEVPQQGDVLLLTGEGGVDLVQDRINHLCLGMYEIDTDDVLDHIIVSADIAPMTSACFAADLTAAVELYQPSLVQLDPLYVYFGADHDAGNVFDTGPALMGLRALTQGRALQVAHHFTKAGADRLTLASLTQAGMREAVDHWLLIAVKEADLLEQRFTLDMDRGARRGLAWSKTAEIILGPFDSETLKHSGTPSVDLGDRAKTDRRRMADCARNATDAVRDAQTSGGDAFAGLPTRWVLAAMTVKAAKDLKLAGIAEAVRAGSLRVKPGPRNAALHFWAKDYPA